MYLTQSESVKMTKYILAHYSIRDGEIEYGDKTLFQIEGEINELAILKQIAEENLGEEGEDWKYDEKENYVEGIGCEYRIIESPSITEIPREDFEILKKYLGSSTL